MIVVTTPMCKQIVEWAGLKEFKVNKFPDEEEGDLAILLSESKVKMNSLTLKLNTFSQIRESILKVSNYCFEHDLTDHLLSDDDIDDIFSSYDLKYANLGDDDFDKIRESNSNKKVKVYSEFLKDIVLDIGALVVDEDYSYVVYPDYLKDIVDKNEDFTDSSIVFIEMPSHGKVSKNPLERTEERYSILINSLI
ncbi:hypothetical protein mru_1948 [Methanobrevibacter ruminantium M1]|uniref:Uncharacterized protein n=1 Tax=Methanobrevibacter ruminantium (strain ATCC 35063 / DSM 1093 / JCM 13430 / OCM 146 / M1) TaxID=634498 RepID=D3E074_METRM|nr:hypothetical protein [Methanobrevibacter ruminantium]ADC47798.1 hypothetical protein mru_1948 [Methanobrevibacter ruminantium M1]